MTSLVEIIGQAVVLAARSRGFDPVVVMQKGGKDGRVKCRQLAAAALVMAKHANTTTAARLLGINRAQCCGSQLDRAGITPQDVARIAAALPKPEVAATTIRADTTYTDPRRDLARERQILDARKAGEGPRALARRFTCSPFYIHTLVKKAEATGEVFPLLRAGRKGGGAAKVIRLDKDLRPVAPRAPREPKAPKAVDPPPVETVAVEAFPDDHATWAPLDGPPPVRLIDHVDGCRWPVTVPDSTAPMVCNHIRTGATPYCERHFWLSASSAIRKTLVRPAGLPTPRRLSGTFTQDLDAA